MLRKARITNIVLGIVFLILSANVFAELQPTSSSEVKASLASSANILPRSKLHFAPLKLAGGTNLTLVSPHEWTYIGERLLSSLKKTHQYYLQLFNRIPAFSTTLRLMDEDVFYRETGAPKWTNALYFRGQIIIPLSRTEAIDLKGIFRSVRHEYMHAAVHALSRGKCAGWLDEGLAQWAEGKENPALTPVLYEWLTDNRPLPLSILRGGFTKLDNTIVPVAYAQSLFASKLVFHLYGFKDIQKYFKHLRLGQTHNQAFYKSFGLREIDFDKKLEQTLVKWQKHLQPK